MRNRAAALLIVVLAPGCARFAPHDQRSPESAIAAPSAAATVPSTSVPPTTGATTSRNRPFASTPTIEPPLEFATSASVPDAAEAAERIVEQLTAATGVPDVADAALWSAVVNGGHIIQTTVLAESANRVSIAVSIAFDNTDDVTEPIGLRVELLNTADGWTVTAIGYL